MRFWGLFVLLFLLSIVISGCSLEPDTVNIGLIPTNKSNNLLKDFSSIKDYLEKEMNVKVNATIAENYYDLIKDMKEKKIDIGLYGPFSYIMAERELELEPMAVPYYKGSGTYYNSYIIVKANSKIVSVEDLKGKSFTFVDPVSTSGFLFPSALFKSRDIDINTYLSRINFSGSHDTVAMDILNEVCDAGAISSLQYNKLLERGRIKKDDFKIIWKSGEIPNSLYIGRKDINKSIKEKFIKAMLSMWEKAPEAAKAFDPNIERYVEPDDNTYNAVRNVIQIFGEDFIKANLLKNK